MVGMTKRRESLAFGGLRKDHFEPHRWRCILAPERAQGTLKPFATLNVAVGFCRDLIGNKSHTFTREASSDPYFEIYVDDKLVFTSAVVHGTVNPNFKDGPQSIPIYHPLSIVRVQILDKQNVLNKVFRMDDILGFVEFAVGDLPIETPVHGLFELRFRTMLLGLASERFKKHKAHRDENLSVFLPTDEVMPEDGESLVPLDAKEEFENVDPMSTMALRKKKRRKGLLAFCTPSIPHSADRTQVSYATGTNAVEYDSEPCHLNGGECFMELFLVTSATNEFFAVCLPKPKWTNFPPPILRRTDLPQVDLQEILDTSMYVKDKIVDHGLLCVADFFTYLLTWQDCSLSCFNLAVAVLFCLWPERVFSIVPGTIGVYMVLFSSPEFRRRVTVNAHTAPLNDIGYRQIASLDNTKSATTWIKRVIKSMHGFITNEDLAECFSALTVRDGVPVLPSYAALEQELRIAASEPDTWVTFPAHKIAEDTPVTILPDNEDENSAGQEELGKVVRCNPDGTYVVFTELSRTNKLVDEHRLRKRMKAPYVPQWIIPIAVENQLRVVYSTMSQLRDQLIPLMKSAQNIICWQSWYTSFFITVACFAITTTLVLVHLLDRTEDCVIRGIKLSVGFLFVFATFVFPSWWFQRFVTIMKAIAFRMRHLKKYEYKKWAFFHEMSPGLYSHHELTSLVHNAY